VFEYQLDVNPGQAVSEDWFREIRFVVILMRREGQFVKFLLSLNYKLLSLNLSFCYYYYTYYYPNIIITKSFWGA
jgi:hypothetical protein